jgi:hypothetical protein
MAKLNYVTCATDEFLKSLYLCQKKQLMTFLKTRTFWTILGYVLGAVGGYIYFLNVKCETGCYMKTSPVYNVIFGFFIGGFLFQFIHEFFIAKQK